MTTLTETLHGAVGGVAVDRLGVVYAADFGERVWKISPRGEVHVLAQGLYGSSGNAVGSLGRLYQSNFHANTVSRIARDGTVVTVAQGLEGPVGITIDDDERLYV